MQQRHLGNFFVTFGDDQAFAVLSQECAVLVNDEVVDNSHRFADFHSKAYNYRMTVAIAKIRSKFSHDAFEFSLHATDQTILRGIRVSEIRGPFNLAKSSRIILTTNMAQAA